MRIYRCLFLLVFLWQMNLSAQAEETNDLYVTDDGSLFWTSTTNGSKFMDPQKVEEAKKSRESLPAKDFPEGNWGEAQAGFQLSLRFLKQVFTNGESITAVLLLRNVTNHFLLYQPVAEPEDGPVRFHVTAVTGEIIPERRPLGELGGGLPELQPRTQRKFDQHLNYGFDLTNGIYNVYACKLVVGYPNPVEVKSAPVTIKIISPP